MSSNETEPAADVMFEDQLPEDMPRADYDKWFARSWIPGGVGCRVGPRYPFSTTGDVISRVEAVRVAKEHDFTHNSGYRCDQGKIIAMKIATIPAVQPATTAHLDSKAHQLVCGARIEALEYQLTEARGEGEAMRRVFLEIQDERTRQDEQRGGVAHDDEHGTFEWFEYIQKQKTQGYHAAMTRDTLPEARERLVKIAALAVAGIESFDRRDKGDNDAE